MKLFSDLVGNNVIRYYNALHRPSAGDRVQRYSILDGSPSLKSSQPPGLCSPFSCSNDRSVLS